MSHASDERLQPLWSRADMVIIALPLGSWYLCISSERERERENIERGGESVREGERVREIEREREKGTAGKSKRYKIKTN